MASRSRLSAENPEERKKRVSKVFKERRKKAYEKERAENTGEPMKTAPQKKSGDSASSLTSRYSVGGQVGAAKKRKRKLLDRK